MSFEVFNRLEYGRCTGKSIVRFSGKAPIHFTGAAREFLENHEFVTVLLDEEAGLIAFDVGRAVSPNDFRLTKGKSAVFISATQLVKTIGFWGKNVSLSAKIDGARIVIDYGKEKQ